MTGPTINMTGADRTRQTTVAQKKRTANRTAFLFLAPFLVLYVLMTLWPIVRGFWISLHNWEIVGTNIRFVGLLNYERIFADGLFWSSLEHTIQFLLFSGPGLVAVGLGLALLLNLKIRGMGIFRTIFYMPNILSVSVVGIIFARIFASGSTGVANSVLQSLGGEPIKWLSDPDLALPTVALTTLWWTVGFNMIIFLAGLQDIPRELYDASKVDGANAWSRFRHVTLPGLRRPIMFVLVLQIIASFQVFGQIRIMTLGGPAGHTRTIVYYMFERAFDYWQLGYGSALAFILFLLLMVLSAIQIYFFSRSEAKA
jgi:multiple sugar transport system permease protein